MGKNKDKNRKNDNINKELEEKYNRYKEYIESHEEEYNEKLKKSQELDAQLKDKELLILQIHEEEEIRIMESLAEEINVADGLKSEAYSKMDEALKKEEEIIQFEKNKKIELSNLELEKRKTIQEERKNIISEANDYKSKTEKEANDYKSKTEKEANDYKMNTKKEADSIKKEANSYKEDIEKSLQQQKAVFDLEVSNRQKELEDQKKFNEEEEKRIRDFEQNVCGREIEVKKKEQSAKFGFQKELKEERKKYDEEIEKVNKEISELYKNLVEGKAVVDQEINEYRKDKIDQIDEELDDEREKIEKDRNDLAKKEAKLEEKEEQLIELKNKLNIQKDILKARTKELDSEIEQKVNEEYTTLISERDKYKEEKKSIHEDYVNLMNKNAELTRRINESGNSELIIVKEENKNLKEKLRLLTEDEASIYAKLKKYNVDSSNLIGSLYKIENFDKLSEKNEELITKLNESRGREAENRVDQKQLEQTKREANQYQDSLKKALEEIDRINNPKPEQKLSRFKENEDLIYNDSKRPFPVNFSEINWLDMIYDNMIKSGIKIKKRLIYAFHTALKIHDWSPLVVLAGVSGTGKSELPRQYAQNGGINFVHIPVKPDWDSMQSLFGYYNSIEKKFEPTELANVIWNMEKDAKLKDSMLLVLLDEMNLAYVELYFSDMLSNFESKRGQEKEKGISYEISLGSDEPEELLIGDNILWVGTMNEDETTKALSDKVIDRSTLINFPRPKVLESRDRNSINTYSNDRMTIKKWKEWCDNGLTNKDIDPSIEKKYKDIIEDINNKMSEANRNLGHRVWQSIELYMLNHPRVIESKNCGEKFNNALQSAFAEAVAFKVMPKLRGIEVSGDSKNIINAIESTIETYIPELADDYIHARSLTTRIFQWSSAEFIEKDDKIGEK